jgi:small-conductance mechanosensitive channel
MQVRLKKVVWLFLLLMVAFMLSSAIVCAQKPKGQADSAAEEAKPVPPIGLADLMSLSAELANRLSVLERNLKTVSDVSAIENEFSLLEKNLKAHSDSIQNLKKSKRYSYDQLAEIKAIIVADVNSLQDVRQPLTDRIKQVELWNSEWLEKQTKWKNLQSSLSKDVGGSTVKSTIAQAQKTIAKGLKLIGSHLAPLLVTESKAAGIQARIDGLLLEVDDLLQVVRSDLFQKSAPPMWSSEYLAGFHPGLWDDVGKGWQVVSRPKWQNLERNKWVLLLHVFLTLFLSVSVLRKRSTLAEQKNLRFVAQRPFSAGILAGFMILMPFYGLALGIWRLLFLTAVCVAIARLAAKLITRTWKRWVVYVLVVILILDRFIQVINLPLPLFRLYVFLVSLTGVALCLWLRVIVGRQGASRLYRWALELGALVALVALAAELGGYAAMAAHLLESSIKTTLLLVAGWMLILLLRGGLDWALYSSPLVKFPLLRRNAAVIAKHSTLFIYVLVGALVISDTLAIWGVFENQFEAMQWILSIGFSIGTRRLTIGIALAAGFLLYGSFLASRAVRSILMEDVLPRREVDRGAQMSMARLVHYGFVLVGFLLALMALGVDLRNVTIIGGALGVGIGFGLQTIVNNFVCGLILLFERPVSVGDYIELGGQWAEIKKIGLRSTIVQTFDRADLVIPNSDLITNQVTNWTRSDRLARIKIPVGVAYGSDVPLVMKILQECAEENPSVVKSPEPRIYFMGFGESSLDFEMRVHLADIDDWFRARTVIIMEIERKFRESGVEIPFPQRDLHLRSVDESVSSSAEPVATRYFRLAPDSGTGEED